MPCSLGRPFNPTSATPARLARLRFGLAPFRSPLLRCRLTSSGYVRCFSSPAYLHPDYVFIGGSPCSSHGGVSPFGHPRLPACTRLPEAFRCFATSFIGIHDQGIHRTPCVTVSLSAGSPPSPTNRVRTHSTSPRSATEQCPAASSRSSVVNVHRRPFRPRDSTLSPAPWCVKGSAAPLT